MQQNQDSRVIRFTVEGEPTGKGRPRFTSMSTKEGKTFSKAYTPQKTLLYENLVKWQYKQAARGYTFPETAMLDMRIVAYYTIPKSKPKKTKALMESGAIRPTKKPDMDNVMKIIADSLNGLAYKDDTQIVDAQCRKFYSNSPRVEVTISAVEMENEDEN